MKKESLEGWIATGPFVVWFTVNIGVGLLSSGSLDATIGFFTGEAYIHNYTKLVEIYKQAPVVVINVLLAGFSLAAALRENIRPGRQVDQTSQETAGAFFELAHKL